MDDSYIIEPKDPSAIVKLQDRTIIQQMLEQPFAVLAESLAGYFAVGNGFFASAGVRLAQSAFKGEVFQQFEKELRYLRKKGRIPDDFTEKKYGKKSWVELLTILDEEIPDEDRLEALKAMFYSVNKINITDGVKIANYQLFQLAKKLTSSQLLLLKAAHERATEPGFQPLAGFSSPEVWLEAVSSRLGHTIFGLIEQDELVLTQNGLITSRTGVGVNDHNGRMTLLAIKFLQNLQTYRTDLADAGDGE